MGLTHAWLDADSIASTRLSGCGLGAPIASIARTGADDQILCTLRSNTVIVRPAFIPPDSNPTVLVASCDDRPSTTSVLAAPFPIGPASHPGTDLDIGGL